MVPKWRGERFTEKDESDCCRTHASGQYITVELRDHAAWCASIKQKQLSRVAVDPRDCSPSRLHAPTVVPFVTEKRNSGVVRVSWSHVEKPQKRLCV